jgi:hypothetical protein
MIHRWLGIGLVLVGAAWQQAESGQFTFTQGGNQIATERFTRSDTSISSDLRLANGLRVTFAARLSNGVVSDVTLQAFAPTDSLKPAQTATVKFAADSMTLQTMRDGAPVTEKRAAPTGVVPYVNPSAVWMEEIVLAAKRSGGTTATVPIAILSAPQQIVQATVTFGSATQATLQLADVELNLTLDERGRILRGEVPAQAVVFTRSN